ncbi:MAG: elongation factor Ts [bacterium]|nr:elongation factor Ts [bacterium]
MDKTLILKLHESTGAGVVDCKKTLEATKGDYDAALKILQEKGLSTVEKRAGRHVGAGLVHSYVHNGRIGVLLDLRAETDFVVRSEPFQTLAHELVMQITAMNPANIEELLKQPYIKDPSKTVDSLVKEVIAKTGENVQVNTFARVEL